MRLEPLLRAEITLAGRVLPSVAELDARYTLETDDRALTYRRLAAGEPVDPAHYYMRTTPRFETGAERYRWLNGLICVASAPRRAAAVELEVFAVQ